MVESQPSLEETITWLTGKLEYLTTPYHDDYVHRIERLSFSGCHMDLSISESKGSYELLYVYRAKRKCARSRWQSGGKKGSALPRLSLPPAYSRVSCAKTILVCQLTPNGSKLIYTRQHRGAGKAN